MDIRIEDRDKVTICCIVGDVDINTAPHIKKAFDKMLLAKKEKIVINFKDVNYIDSSGLATLVEMLKNMRGYGGKLKLSNLSSKIKSLFEITRLEKLFEIMVDEQEAISSFV